ncbi:MAG: universal stress protein [Drouetiella hepatica Uher 2000/2452]|jgi:nucleotide-binding universal stress UspA family protein|uniref:Universal stress protein n=1 Tax=Drouetiella hepatica Uher 2000/2452 TaxID=904376 RepID=A0A951QGV8_9CYAN|nr:universal stress protein [Drouetiella hepatica Uher 2000/2452]
MGFKRILAAIDHSPLSQLVFEQALDLAKTNQANLMLFHSVSADTVALSPVFPGEFGVSPQFINQAYQGELVRLEQQIQEIQATLQHFYDLARQADVAATYQYKIAEPGQGLCEAAQQWQADLMIVGRRGRKGLTEALLGSVSNYVLHHSPCAVLVIQSAGLLAGQSERSAFPQASFKQTAPTTAG